MWKKNDWIWLNGHIFYIYTVCFMLSLYFSYLSCVACCLKAVCHSEFASHQRFAMLPHSTAVGCRDCNGTHFSFCQYDMVLEDPRIFLEVFQLVITDQLWGVWGVMSLWVWKAFKHTSLLVWRGKTFNAVKLPIIQFSWSVLRWLWDNRTVSLASGCFIWLFGKCFDMVGGPCLCTFSQCWGALKDSLKHQHQLS